jgi:soluble lytic murein transglycosylase-like protein
MRGPGLTAMLVALTCVLAPACGGMSTTHGTVASSPQAASPPQIYEALRTAVAAWKERDPGLAGRPPAAVLAAAAHERELVHRLSLESPSAAARTLGALHGDARRAMAADVAAARNLRRLTGPGPAQTLHLVPALPAGELLADYRLAQRRFGVDWSVLAAVNLVESAFGRVVNHSSAGAQGPMQFLPATWRSYGLGGNVHTPRDAILGAANYLHQSGAPGDTARALYAYNPSRLYVSAVLAYARQMRDDPLAFPAYYAWEASLPATLTT